MANERTNLEDTQMNELFSSETPEGGTEPKSLKNEQEETNVNNTKEEEQSPAEGDKPVVEFGSATEEEAESTVNINTAEVEIQDTISTDVEDSDTEVEGEDAVL